MYFAMKNPESLMRLNRLIQSTYSNEDLAGIRARAATSLAAAYHAQRAAVMHLPTGETDVRLPRVTLTAEDADPRGITMNEVREAAFELTRLLFGTVADDGTRFLAPDHTTTLLEVIISLLARLPGPFVRVPGRETTARSAWSI